MTSLRPDGRASASVGTGPTALSLNLVSGPAFPGPSGSPPPSGSPLPSGSPSLLQAAPTWRCFTAAPFGLKIERPDVPLSELRSAARNLGGLVHSLTTSPVLLGGKRPFFLVAHEGTALDPVHWSLAGANTQGGQGSGKLLVREDLAQTGMAPVLVRGKGTDEPFSGQQAEEEGGWLLPTTSTR